MDEIMPNEFLENGLSLTSASISSVVGAIIGTLFLRKNTKTSEFEKIKAGKFNVVIDQLLESGDMTYLEYYKCNNFLEIAKKADLHIQKVHANDTEHQNQIYDFDWFVKFYDYAGNISNSEIQELWALILAREITSPHQIPLSLLHSLSIMRSEQANLFCNISRFALRDIKSEEAHLLIFISSNREAYKDSGITPSLLKEIERLGLIECDFKSEYIFLNKKAFKTGNKIITVYGDPNNENKIKSGNVCFTKDGQLLYSILEGDYKNYRSDILDFTLSKFSLRNCNIQINDNKLI